MEAPSPADIIALRQALAVALGRADEAEADAANARAINSDLEARIALQALQIEVLKRDRFGQRSERSRRLIDQLELALEAAEATASEDEAAVAIAAAKTTTVTAFVRARPSRQPLPAHLPRTRVVIPSPTCCAGCGSNRLSKLGEDITETLEVVPRQWKVVQTVRERFACRACETISQPPAPFHVTPRGLFGASLLAMILFEKFGQHQPLNRQRDRYAHEGVDLSLSTLADQVGACTAALRPLYQLIEAHVLAAERLHGDDTTVPVLAKVKTDIGRIWTYVRDDRPFGGPAPPAAVFHYSRDRRGEHPRDHFAHYGGILQADAVACPRASQRPDPGAGYNELFKPGRSPGAVTRALCWAHARRKFFVLADVATQVKRKPGLAPVVSPLALAVTRIDRIFDIERGICGKTADERLAVHQELAVPLVAELDQLLREQRATLSRHTPVAKAIIYMLSDWTAFTRFLADGRICLTNNAAERALRGIALGRKSWLFAGSDRGGQRAAFMYSLIVTAKLNNIDP